MKKLGLYVVAAIALVIAVRSEEDAVKVAAAAVSAGSASYVATARLLELEQERKQRQAIAESYVNLLRSVEYRQRPPRVSSRPLACRGCYHYFGQTYGGNKLICAMHPFGVEGETCEDWEASPHACDR